MAASGVSKTGPSARSFTVDYLTIASAGTVQRLYANHNPVLRAVIQNVSGVNITFFGTGTSGEANGTASQGPILNSASTGQAGGSLTVGNVDLYYMYWVGGAGAALAVYYET